MRHHLPLALLSAALIAAISSALPTGDVISRLSMATAYAGLALLGTTLLLGPLNVLRARPSPVSTDLRRDIGIWAGVVSLAHVVVGLQAHLRGRPWLYFVYGPDEHGPTVLLHAAPLRLDAFGVANHTGLVATLLLALLLTLSNDLALRRLGSGRWKTLQRLNYGVFALVAMHGILYQRIQKRDASLVAVFTTMVLAVLIIQLAGFLRRRLKPSS